MSPQYRARAMAEILNLIVFYVANGWDWLDAVDFLIHKLKGKL